MGRAADAAVQQSKGGRKLLPEALCRDYDRIVRAFAQVESRQDDNARETLQGISLRSPFLEWKYLLRGLQAFYQGQDARALENWQRLQPDRLPARLAAPLRILIDARIPACPACRNTGRSEETSRPVPGRWMHAPIADDPDGTGRPATAGAGLPPGRECCADPASGSPQLLPRLAACFFWAIVDRGQFEDVSRYQRSSALLPMILNWTASTHYRQNIPATWRRPTIIGNNMRKPWRGRIRQPFNPASTLRCGRERQRWAGEAS